MFWVPFIKTKKQTNKLFSRPSLPHSLPCQWVGKSHIVKRLNNWIYCQHKQTDYTVKHFMDCCSTLTCQIPTNVSLQLPRYHWIFLGKSARSPRLRTKRTGQWIIYDGKRLHKEHRKRDRRPSASCCTTRTPHHLPLT